MPFKSLNLYTLHFRRAFKNIFELLDQDGECFMIFLACNPIYDVYRILSRNSKWSSWLKDVEKYISPYHDKTVRQLNAINKINTNIPIPNYFVRPFVKEYVTDEMIRIAYINTFLLKTCLNNSV